MNIKINEKIFTISNPISIIDLMKENNIDSNKNILKYKNLVLPYNAIVKNDCQLEIVELNEKIYKASENYISKIIMEISLLTSFKQANIAIQNKDIEVEEYASMLFDTAYRIKKEDLEILKNNFLIVLKDIEQIKIKNEILNKSNLYKESYYISDKYKIDEIEFPIIEFKDIKLLQIYPMFLNNYKNSVLEILHLSGEYFNNSEDKEMLQKISFVVAKDNKQLDKILKEIEEKKQRDHRYINENLEIFNIDPLIGLGLPFWLPNGAILKQEIKKFLKEKEFEYRFIQIESPVIGSKQLYETSGHWNHYKENMFAPMEMPGNETLLLRPMNCPHHISIFKSKIRSYKELPLRFVEHAIQHRYEFSGALTGLERVRAMELTDSHIFVMPSQLKQEFINCYNLIIEVLEKFDIKIKYLSLSLRDPNDKQNYYDNDKMWENAEKQLEQMLQELKLDYKKMVGEAAFYGPKLDIQVETALGHEITVSTIQLDFLLPERFKLEYVDKNGDLQRPIMIHRGLIGTYERFVAILLEQTLGVLPLWCSPIQVAILPVSEKFNDYASKIEQILHKNKIRCLINDKDERLNNKIRTSLIKKIPYIIVVGSKEEQNNLVTYRTYKEEKQIEMQFDNFLDKIVKEYENRD